MKEVSLEDPMSRTDDQEIQESKEDGAMESRPESMEAASFQRYLQEGASAAAGKK